MDPVDSAGEVPQSRRERGRVVDDDPDGEVIGRNAAQLGDSSAVRPEVGVAMREQPLPVHLVALHEQPNHTPTPSSPSSPFP